MNTRIKHKLAWWLRRWANKLEPEVCAPMIEAPIIYGHREYKLSPLKVAVDHRYEKGTYGYKYEIEDAGAQMSKAVEKLIETQHNQPGPGGNNRTILQLLILTPKDNVYTSDV
jgi:hypothetical protein